VIPVGSLAAVGIVNCVADPAVVIRPIVFVFAAVNQSAPSGPATMSTVPVGLAGGNEVTLPEVVILEIFDCTRFVYQSAPSGPVVIPG
jgi:hypothetical protein